jgi:murein DD-endopeptidase MepM/ murein hydrolase activator NlpD
MQTAEVLHNSAENKGEIEDAVALTQRLQTNRFSNPLSLEKASRFLRRLVQRAGIYKSAPRLQTVFKAEDVIALRNNDEDLSIQEGLADADFVRNDERVRASTEQLAAARQMMRQMQEVITSLQSHLARIDAQIQRRQERDAIANGTLDALHNKYAPAVFGPVEFFWPAIARITASFREASYKRFFGIPHNGMDIAVPQGIPVKAAADGVVFLARDAGMGYSYVLIGHREGYATLYGHLSKIDVVTGDAISAGQRIGSSGGAKGGRGSGLVTTGAHLHFEMIKDGTYIDPRTKLPE